MAVHEDWLLSQIHMLIQFFARTFFGKDTAPYEIVDPTPLAGSDPLQRAIEEKLASDDLCGAEDLLFDAFEAGNLNHLRLAITFYDEIARLSDGELRARNFSREEIFEGLCEILQIYKLPLPFPDFS